MTNAREDEPNSAGVAEEQQNEEENQIHLHSLTVDTTHVAEEGEKGTFDKNSGPLLTPATYRSEEEDEDPSDSTVSDDHDPNNPRTSNEDTDANKKLSLGDKWAAMIHSIRYWVTKGLQFLTYYAATWPRITLILCASVSIALLAGGYFVDFKIELDNYDLWPPKNSLSRQHLDWYLKDAHFAFDPVEFNMIIHRNGDNVLSKDGVERVFEVMDAITSMDGYKDGCEVAERFSYLHWMSQCHIISVADFWNETRTTFESTVETDEDAILFMSQLNYPNGVLVDTKKILGNVQYQREVQEGVANEPTAEFQITEAGNGTEDGLSGFLSSSDRTDFQLASAQSYIIQFLFPWSNEALEFEARATDKILELQQQWDMDPENPFQLELATLNSFGDEFLRAIIIDLPLLPIAFCLMCGFTLLVFAKCHRVHSRGLLGVGAVLCIVASTMSAYGIMFFFGVPFHAQTTMLPFLMFGIGLDDSFIIYGSYNRKDPSMDVVERVQATIEDIGMSVFLTSITSALAFGLGAFSGIPAVSWLCLYAFPAILFDLFYQVTFFIALLVLDERRIQASRMDWCTCIRVEEASNNASNENQLDQNRQREPETIELADDPLATYEENDNDNSNRSALAAPQSEESNDGNSEDRYIKTHPADRFMSWFATQLLKPEFQALAVLAFCFVLGGSIYNATQLRQEFDFTDLVPKDSYLKRYYRAKEMYSTVGLYNYAIFRDVDQSDPAIQEQMEKYVNDLATKGPADEPTYFWLRDFKAFMNEPENKNLTDLSFEDQIREFLDIPFNNELYDSHIGRPTGGGTVYESRVRLHVNVDLTDSKDATEMLASLRKISKAQEINRGQEDWKFFTYDSEYHVYEFYNKVVQELIFTTIMGVVAVSVIALFFIPHWTAMPFTLVFITILYIEMLGFLYMSGVQINAISYVTLVMSIGLMVDYIMHVLLRYFESRGTRGERVKETLSTLGASMLLGAISTLLGVIALVGSTSTILQSVFLSIIGLISLGVLNGLVFLPVALALIGPE